jgi:hypothetical protein
MCVCTFGCTVYVCVCLHVRACACMYVYVSVCLLMYVFISPKILFMDVCTHTYVCVCMYTCTRDSTYTRTRDTTVLTSQPILSFGLKYSWINICIGIYCILTLPLVQIWRTCSGLHLPATNILSLCVCLKIKNSLPQKISKCSYRFLEDILCIKKDKAMHGRKEKAMTV